MQGEAVLMNWDDEEQRGQDTLTPTSDVRSGTFLIVRFVSQPVERCLWPEIYPEASVVARGSLKWPLRAVVPFAEFVLRVPPNSPSP
jgi:hypothetical protein